MKERLFHVSKVLKSNCPLPHRNREMTVGWYSSFAGGQFMDVFRFQRLRVYTLNTCTTP